MKIISALLALAMLSLIFPSSAFAGFGEGLAAYKKRDYETALREIQPLAEHGNA